MQYKRYLSKAWLTIGGTPFQSPTGLQSVTPDKAGFLGSNIFQLAISLLLLATVLMSLFFLIRGGISWTMSGGDPKAIAAAKQRLIYAVLGLILAFSSFIIINAIGYMFHIDLLGPPALLPNETT